MNTNPVQAGLLNPNEPVAIPGVIDKTWFMVGIVGHDLKGFTPARYHGHLVIVGNEADALKIAKENGLDAVSIAVEALEIIHKSEPRT